MTPLPSPAETAHDNAQDKQDQQPGQDRQIEPLDRGELRRFRKTAHRRFGCGPPGRICRQTHHLASGTQDTGQGQGR